jgi:hypothetical protein
MTEHPTVLWHPTSDGANRHSASLQIVIVIANGEMVYRGAGPVKVTRPNPAIATQMLRALNRRVTFPS